MPEQWTASQSENREPLVTTAYHEEPARGSETSTTINLGARHGVVYIEFYDSEALSSSAQGALLPRNRDARRRSGITVAETDLDYRDIGKDRRFSDNR
jgi:hypothetical protein